MIKLLSDFAFNFNLRPCVMARICHTNNCPVGVATQREELRARFPGTALQLQLHLGYPVVSTVGPALACNA